MELTTYFTRSSRVITLTAQATRTVTMAPLALDMEGRRGTITREVSA